jgi:2-succinyl-5-enolpyruvyl-6-hydroxy-3-cyclohexene-1-carboxylate synthase
VSEVAQSVLDACAAEGITDYVVCAGARNAPLVLGLLSGEGLNVWNHFEERGAGFFALGRTMDTGRPCVVVTTSGTAAAELLPAVIEAHYQERPLVVITADRPAHYRGSGAPQSIEQVGLYGSYVEGCLDLEQAGAVFEGWSGLRPWHLNVCLAESEETPVMGALAAPEPPPRKRPGVVELKKFLQDRIFEGLVVALGGLEPEEREDAYHFLKDLGVPVLADATSGLREVLGGLVLPDGDRLLRSRLPGKVLRLGDVPVGRFWRDLEDLPDVEVLSVTRTGFSGLGRSSTVLQGRVDHVLRGLGSVGGVGDVLDHFELARKRKAELDELLVRYPDSEPSLMRVVSTYATLGESVYLGNSLPIREWNLVAQRESPLTDVRASRGANGIDGQLSTWLGATVGQDGAWAVVGDLTTLYDLAAPALLAQVGGAGRVLVVVNNGGGRIFERLPRLAGMNARASEVVANAHQRGFGHWAAMWGMEHLRVETLDALDLEPGEGTLLLELCPDAKQTAEFWAAYGKLSS